MKQLIYTIFFGFLACAAAAQSQYNWEAIPGARTTTLQLLHVENDIFIGYMWGRNRFAYSNDQGENWTVLHQQTGEDRYTSKEVSITSSDIYILFESKRLYRYDRATGTPSLLLDAQRSINDLTIQGDTLFFRQENTLKMLPPGATLPIASNHTGYTRLLALGGNFLLHNRDDSLVTIVDRRFNTLVAPQAINLSRWSRLEAYRDRLFFIEGMHLMESTNLGQTWTSLHEFSQGGDFEFSGETVSNLGFDEFSVFNLETNQLTGPQSLPTVRPFLYWQHYNSEGTIILYNQDDDQHLKVDQNDFILLPTTIDNPSTKRVIAIDENAAFFEFTRPFTYIASDQQWIPAKNYRDVYLTGQGDLIATQNDSVYISSDRGASFTVAQHAVSGRIRLDTNGRLYIFNQDNYFISNNDGYTWDREVRRNYFSHFTLHLEGLNHIFPIDDKLYGLSERANVLKMGSGVATQLADFPYNGSQDYRSFVVNTETDPFVLFYESFQSEDAVFMRKLGNDNEVELPIPIDADEMYIDKEDRIYIHDRNQVYRSADKGDSWTDLTGNLPDSVNITSFDIATDGTVYIASNQTDAYKLRFGQSTSSINTVQKEAALQLYPSPAMDVLHVTDLQTGVGRYIIYDLQGRQVQAGTIGATAELSVSALRPGVYVLRLMGKGLPRVGKFLKE